MEERLSKRPGGIQHLERLEIVAGETLISRDKSIGVDLHVCRNQEVGYDSALRSSSRQVMAEGYTRELCALAGGRKPGNEGRSLQRVRHPSRHGSGPPQGPPS